MKKMLLLVVLSLFVAASLNGQTTFNLLDSAHVSTASFTPSDSGYSGGGYRVEFSTSFHSTTPTLVPYVLYAANYAQRPMPSKVLVRMRSPLWVSGTTRVALSLDRGGVGDTSSTSMGLVVYPSSDWQNYEFTLAPGGSYAFSRLRISFSIQGGAAGTRVVFIDDIRIINGSDTTIIDSGGPEPTPAPSTPALSFPANSATNVTVPVTFQWNAATNATSYRIQVSNEAGNIISDATVSGTTKQVSGLSSGAHYFWRVQAGNASGWSSWSGSWSFTTKTDAPAIPSAPSLTSPANGATNLVLPITFQWNSSANATSYQLQILSGSSVVKDLTTSGTSLAVSDLQAGSSYTWQVRAGNSSGWSGWSGARTFSTQSDAPAIPAAPALTSPANSATNLVLPITFQWNSSTYATSYQLQILSGSTVVKDLTTSGTSLAVSDLLAGTTYTWKVKAGNSSGWSSWSSVRTFSTQSDAPAIPAAPALVSPANSATNLVLPITFQWNASTNATSYQLQVLSGSSVIKDLTTSGISLAIGDLATGTTYTWKVRAGNSSGWSSWSSVRTFTTQSDAPAIPAVPSLTSPANSAVNLVLPITFQWSSSTYATSYRIQILQGSNVVKDLTLSGTTVSVSDLAYSTSYTWRVQAGNSSGWSSWSGTRAFTTQSNTPAIPSAPTPLSPISGSTNLTLPITFQWNASANATSYQLQILSGSSVVKDLTTSGTSLAVSGLQAGTFYTWRVLASNTSGSSLWSIVWGFTTKADDPVPTVPETPVHISPLNGKTGLTLPILLQWSASSGAEAYRVQVKRGSSVIKDTTLSGTSCSISGLLAGTYYTWHVLAQNSAGSSAWSAIWGMTTKSDPTPTVPVAPTLTSPANSSTNLISPITFQWNAVADASAYRLQIFVGGSLVKDTTLAGTVCVVSGFSSETYHTWRVQAGNTVGWSSWSSTWAFTTKANTPIPTVPAIPVLLSPAHYASGVAIPVTLQWSASTGAEMYRLQISDDAGLIKDTTLAGTVCVVSGLSSGTRYTWHVLAGNTVGYSGWSEARVFVTIGSPELIPSLISPANGATSVSQNPYLVWSSVGSSAVYRIQISSSSNFSSLTYEYVVSGTSHIVQVSLGSGASYYWRVKLEGGMLWSTAFVFTTSISSPIGLSDEEKQEIPKEFSLAQNYPNPFNPSTIIRFALPIASAVDIRIFDILGREVAILARESFRAGMHEVTFDASEFSAGIYFCRIQAGTFVATRKMILLK